MFKAIVQCGITLAALAVLAGGIGLAGGRAAASEPCASGPATYSWQGSLAPYGIRDYTVAYCGPDTLDLYAGARWKGNKQISVVLIAPDGSQQVFTGSRSAIGEVDGPIAQGTWTVVVRNNTSSNAGFTADVSFK